MASFEDYGLICENVDTAYPDKELCWCTYTSDTTSKNENGTNHYLYLNLNDGCKAADTAIPPFAKIFNAAIYADFENSVASNTADIAASITNSNGSTTYLSNFATGKHKGNGSGTTSYSTLTYTATNLFKSEDANAGFIKDSYGGTGAYIQYYFKLYTLTKFNWVARYRLDFYYYKPRTKVTVNGGTGSGIYHYGSTYTITATPPDGYRFLKWEDGDTNSSRTFTVNSSLITAYETKKTYTAVFEKETINNIQIGKTKPSGIYYNATTKTITFVVADAVSITPSGADTVDGYHLVISNTTPTDSVEVKKVQVGTSYVYTI
jgi:hypothetical protein